MKLFGLKDENGKEYVLNVRAVNPDVYQTTYAEPIEPTPKFKVGDWVMISRTGTICSTHEYGNQLKGFNGQYHDLLEPLRVIDIKPIDYQPKAHIVEQNDIPYIFSSSRDFRLATESEIESHLIKVAEKKGFKEEIRYHDAETNSTCIIKENDFWYDVVYDGLTDGWGGWVYYKGKWATIIPDKKPLPKTKGKLIELFLEYKTSNHTSLSDFLKDYED